MTTDKRLLASLARRTPVIWDVIGPIALNPQPLPPLTERRDEVGSELNPQPLPPLAPESIGALVGRELAALAWSADKLGVTVAATADWDEDPCPTYPRQPAVPFHLGVVPVPQPHPEWHRGYLVGLASVLASAELAGLRSDFATDTLDRVVVALQQLETVTA